MRKHIKLNITDPCHESWDKMLPAEKGKFCNACRKEVVDFTSMSDTQVVAFFRKPSNGSVCGRFMQDQLDRQMDIPKKRIPWIKYFFQLVLPAFIMTSKAYTQGKVRMIKGNTMPVIVSDEKVSKSPSKTLLRQKTEIIRGRIMNEINEAIPFASVFIKGTTNGTASDSSGYFSLKYQGMDDEITLVSSCLGFQNAEKPVNIRRGMPVVISLQKNIEMLDEVKVIAYPGTLGRVSYTGAVSVKQKCIWKINIIDTLSDFLFPSNPIAAIYPNPVRSNSMINIKLEKHKQDIYSIELINLAGQLIAKREQWISGDSFSINFHIPSVAAGNYLIRLVNKQSKKSCTENFLIKE